MERFLRIIFPSERVEDTCSNGSCPSWFKSVLRVEVVR